ncbi:hypothetical protein ACFE04_008234 [Oxalis oulophora]
MGSSILDSSMVDSNLEYYTLEDLEECQLVYDDFIGGMYSKHDFFIMCLLVFDSHLLRHPQRSGRVILKTLAWLSLLNFAMPQEGLSTNEAQRSLVLGCSKFRSFPYSYGWIGLKPPLDLVIFVALILQEVVVLEGKKTSYSTQIASPPSLPRTFSPQWHSATPFKRFTSSCTRSRSPWIEITNFSALRARVRFSVVDEVRFQMILILRDRRLAIQF